MYWCMQIIGKRFESMCMIPWLRVWSIAISVLTLIFPNNFFANADVMLKRRRLGDFGEK